jgi:predicted metal-binding protein
MFEIKFNPKILKRFFDIAVAEECRSCKRYSFKSSCPPNIPDIEYYKKLIPSYKNGLLIYERFKIDDKTKWKELGEFSSKLIHRYLLKTRNELLASGYVFNLALTAGSCKICEKCSFPCAHPDLRLVPIEGTGINVIKLAKHFNINLKFPVEHVFLRLGVILWK